ncbi:MAG: hypothetical protein IJZ80_06270 [Clostridia bacterium]|nr:hypothetical protein [Clostridia bacterium]
MKKLLTVVLLCAMLITALVPCATAEQAGAYNNAHESNFKTTLAADASVWDGTTPDATAADAWYAELADNKITIDSAADLACFAVKLNAGTSFADVTVNLEKDIDLGGNEWIQISTATANYFKGTFNGNNHAIGNFKMTLTAKGSNGWGFFGALGGEASIQNLSLINGTLINANASGTKIEYVGGIAGTVAPAAEATITISNIYSNVTYAVGTGEDAPNTHIQRSGGLIGQVNGAGNVSIENVKYVATFALYNNPDVYGALIGRINSVQNITINNCDISATIDLNSNNTVGGIVANINTDGVLGSFTVSNCNVALNSKNSGNSGAIIGKLEKNTTGEYKIENCMVTGTIDAKNYSGGYIGYVGAEIVLQISNCTFNGTLTSGRHSGGFIGHVKLKGTTNKLENCTIGEDAVLNLTVNHKDASTNGTLGGFIGRVETGSSATLTIASPKLKGTFNADIATNATSAVTNQAGGIIGKVNSANLTVSITTPQITGNLNYLNSTPNNSKITGKIAVLCADKDASATVTYDNTVVYNPASVSKAAGLTLTMCGFAADPGANAVVGYQTRANGETAYDLRYVVALNLEYETDYDYAGIEVTINYKNAAEPKTFTAYVEKLYTSVNGDGNTYTAQSLGGKYLYTVVIEGIPNDINVEDATMQVTLKPFTVKGTGESAVTTVGATATHGSVAIAE